MTSDQQRQFEHVWPALSVRLHRLLGRKKVSPWLAEDLVQETGLRLIRMWPEIDQAKPLWPLTATIALNLFRDEMRRAGSNESVQSLPESPSVENVEERGMARVELRAVGGALAQMSARQRNAILADLSEEAPGPLASSVRMLRMRARRRLQHLMDHASVLGVAVGVQMRRAARELELIVGRVLPSDAERATAAAISLLAAISFGVAITPPSPSQAAEPSAVDAANISSAGEQRAAFTAVSSLAAQASTTQAASSSDAIGKSSAAGAARSGDAHGGSNGSGEAEQEETLPAATGYAVEVTDDTYVQGELEAEVVGGGGDPDTDARSLMQSPPSFNCTVTPSQTGASCTASDNGSRPRGVRVQHRGEAWVAGRRLL